MEEQLKKYIKFFIEKNSIDDVDVFSEFQSITEKKSNLSKSKREAVVALVAYSVEEKFKDFVNLIVISNSEHMKDEFELNKVESWESTLKRFIEHNKNYVNSKKEYATISKFECVALKFEFKKLEKGICTTEAIADLNDDEINNLSESLKKRIEETLGLIREEPEEFENLVSLKLIY